MPNLTEKGQYAFKLALKHFKTGKFSAADLSTASGEKIAAATLNGIVNHGYMMKEAGSPVRFYFVENIDELLENEEENLKKGCDNSNLHNAKRKKDDEFYTRYEDIEAEVIKYRKQFNDKIVYLPCDDPAEKKSEFWSFFVNNFDAFNLKKLIATHYDENGKAYKIWIDRDTCTGEFIDDDDALQEDLIGNGDFRSPECVDILKECDIVVTNPPFGLFKDFLPLLMTYEKQFLIIGPLNAATYKEIFPHILTGKIWSGYNNVRHFIRPDGSDRTMGNTFWYTNMPNKCLTEELILTKTYREDLYPKFDDCDVINIDKVSDIPSDYDGLMGVPTSFFQGKYNPNQFKIIGEIKHGSDGPFDFCKPYVNGEEKYTRLVIKRK